MIVEIANDLTNKAKEEILSLFLREKLIYENAYIDVTFKIRDGKIVSWERRDSPGVERGN